MERRLAAMALIGLLPGLAGCRMAHQGMSVDRAESDHYQYSVASRATPKAILGGSAGALQGSSNRHIAVRHKLEILSDENRLPKSWQSVIDFCKTIQCEVVQSSLTARTRDLSAAGNIMMRVAPEDFAKLFAQAEKQGNVVQHITESEDKTSAVVDTEAKLKNLAAYRDSLRSMLAKPALSVKDVVEIQEKLSDVQSQLDSETAARKILADETEKTAVEINFRIERQSARRSGFTPIWDAIRDSGSNLGESLATLIMVIVAVIPWLAVFVLVVWVLKRFWRSRRSQTG